MSPNDNPEVVEYSSGILQVKDFIHYQLRMLFYSEIQAVGTSASGQDNLQAWLITYEGNVTETDWGGRPTAAARHWRALGRAQPSIHIRGWEVPPRRFVSH